MSGPNEVTSWPERKWPGYRFTWIFEVSMRVRFSDRVLRSLPIFFKVPLALLRGTVREVHYDGEGNMTNLVVAWDHGGELDAPPGMFAPQDENRRPICKAHHERR